MAQSVLKRTRWLFGPRNAWRILAVVYVVAVAINYPWELAQASLFTAQSNGAGNIWLHCFVASLGDGLLVLLIFAVAWMMLGDRDWFMRPGIRGYAILLTSGALLAVAVEWIAVHVLGRWSYDEAMPRIPGIDVGLVPVIQMLLLPPLIFFLGAGWNSIGLLHRRSDQRR